MGTTYVYDFPELFRQAIRIQWNRASHHNPNLKCHSNVLEAKELVLDENNKLQEVERAPGTNLSLFQNIILKVERLLLLQVISRIKLDLLD